MKKYQKKFRANNSGQLLVVAALAIAIIISSTTLYVYELSKETNSIHDSSISNFVLALEQATKNTMISSLANISTEGDKTILVANLNELSQVFRSLNHFGICHLTFTPLSDSNYDSGVWLSWNISDTGVSSVYANFTLRIHGIAENVTVNYAVNITTTITISGYYVRIVGNEKQVHLTCNVYNEGKPALAKNITLFYEMFGSWTSVDSSNNPSVRDYGNGTYRISFTVVTTSDTVQVSAYVYDSRDIFVQANTTCSEV